MNNYLKIVWTGRCTVCVETQYQEGTFTRYKEEVLYKDIPCHLSFEKGLGYNYAADNYVNNKITQKVKLFYSSAYTIPPGSTITVTQNGVTEKYKQSGIVAVYKSHCEVSLRNFDEIA